MIIILQQKKTLAFGLCDERSKWGTKVGSLSEPKGCDWSWNSLSQQCHQRAIFLCHPYTQSAKVDSERLFHVLCCTGALGDLFHAATCTPARQKKNCMARKASSATLPHGLELHICRHLSALEACHYSTIPLDSTSIRMPL